MLAEPGMLPLWTYDDMSDLQIVPRGSSHEEKVAARFVRTLAGLMRASVYTEDSNPHLLSDAWW